MKSMTGYGRGEASGEGCTLKVEISAVNSRKQVDMRFSIPRELGMLEPIFRQYIRQKFTRGSLYIAVNFQLDQQVTSAVQQVNHAAAKAAAAELQALAREAGLPAPTMADILAIPGVLNQSDTSPYEPLKELATPALEAAINALQQAQLDEGQRLKSDLVARGEFISQRLERIIAREPEVLKQFQSRLQSRIAELGVVVPADDERLAKEVAFYADKSDITEETVRLRSHLVKYNQLLNSQDDPGRELDFLGQEMNREITTLSSKTTDLDIAEDALAMKIELSKIREQIMNIE